MLQRKRTLISVYRMDPGAGPSKGEATMGPTRQTALTGLGGGEVYEEAERKEPHHPELPAQLKWKPWERSVLGTRESSRGALRASVWMPLILQLRASKETDKRRVEHGRVCRDPSD